MRKLKRPIHQLVALTIPLVTALSVQAVSRPPQFVLLAYDGSKENGMWEKTRQFAKQSNSKLTYFISGVYFLTDSRRSNYRPPAGMAPGRSDIGFGGLQEDLEIRLDHVLQAKAEGNEIASHANGHFDGSKWSSADWGHEFSEFNRLVTYVHQNNGINSQGAQEWQNQFKDSFVGFRAPLLGHSPGLWDTLRSNRYAYDTSKTSQSNYWPQKSAQGIWNFPLASLVVAGTAKKTLSMDYNFYVADSGAKPDPANSKVYEERMLKTYLSYFTKNYYGNRAPIHIGHHFSRWNDGAYLRAFERFGHEVCRLPEVKCVTYQELAQYLDQQSPDTIAEWQSGNFDKFDQKPIAMVDTGTKDIALQVEHGSGSRVEVAMAGKDAKDLLAQGYKLKFEVDGREVDAPITVSQTQNRAQVSIAPLWKGKAFKLGVSLKDKKGIEIQRAEHEVVLTDSGFKVSPKDLDEALRLTSDPPEAHMHE